MNENEWMRNEATLRRRLAGGSYERDVVGPPAGYRGTQIGEERWFTPLGRFRCVALERNDAHTCDLGDVCKGRWRAVWRQI